MLNKFFDCLATVWAVKQELPVDVDVIMFATMAATGFGLTRGSEVIIEKAKEITYSFPNAKVLYSAYAFNKLPNMEACYKKLSFPDGSVYVGEVYNTFHEAYMFWLKTQDLRPRSIVMITDEWHSRSMVYALRKVFAGQKSPTITIVTVPGRSVLSCDNPIKTLRSHWQWALANALRHSFMVLVPCSQQIMLKFKIRQPT